MAVREGFHTVTPYLTTHDLDGLLAFVARAFGAQETHRERGAQGGTHVEVRLGDSMLMVGGLPDASRPATGAMLYLYVDDPDDLYQRAIHAGASSLMPPADTPDGERRAGVGDAWGNQWFFGRPLGAPQRAIGA